MDAPALTHIPIETLHLVFVGFGCADHVIRSSIRTHREAEAAAKAVSPHPRHTRVQ